MDEIILNANDGRDITQELSHDAKQMDKQKCCFVRSKLRCSLYIWKGKQIIVSTFAKSCTAEVNPMKNIDVSFL